MYYNKVLQGLSKKVSFLKILIKNLKSHSNIYDKADGLFILFHVKIKILLLSLNCSIYWFMVLIL